MATELKASLSLETSVDHLKFYEENSISPVRQEIGDLSLFFERRSSLYRHLGLIGSSIRGKGVVEVGPGSGHNSLFVASLMPEKYTLVEPNQTGRDGIKDLYQQFAQKGVQFSAPEVVPEKLEDFAPRNSFDIAICEGWLGVSKHERQMMQKLGELVAEGGVLVTTLASAIGSLPNAMRRVLAYMLTRQQDNFESKTNILVEAFSSHLNTLENMTRPHEDWVQDCMLNPGFMTISVTPEMFVHDLGDKFSLYNSYPNLYTNWQWYKSLHGEGADFNRLFMDQYWTLSHNFIDASKVYPVRDARDNIELERLSFSLLDFIIKLEDSNDLSYLKEIIHIGSKLRNNVETLSPGYVDAFDEWLELVGKDKITVAQVASMSALQPLFGRELLYVSAIKDKE
jgi:hypothetical protein